MAVNAAPFNGMVGVIALIFAVILPMIHAAGLAPAPALAPTSDGKLSLLFLEKNKCFCMMFKLGELPEIAWIVSFVLVKLLIECNF